MDGKISRVTYPTASFSLTVQLIAWLEAEAKRRNLSKSLIVREILEAAIEQQETAA